MAIRRKKRFDKPVKCSICKDVKALHTVHGSRQHGGHTCCDDCYPGIKEVHEREAERERIYVPTDADYQTWMGL